MIPPMDAKPTWVVALGLGGEVLGAERGAPASWLGKPLHRQEGVPASLREAARAVVLDLRRGETLAKVTVDVPELDATVELFALPVVALQRDRTDVRALLQHAVTALVKQARALDVDLTVTTDADVPATITVDPEKIAWVVAALAGNAMRYVRAGTRHMPGGSVAVRAILDATREQLVVAVEDDGPGIPAQVAERLFQRAPGAPLATGLALGVARDVVAAHGGSIAIESSTDEDDHGTVVMVRLPLD